MYRRVLIVAFQLLLTTLAYLAAFALIHGLPLPDEAVHGFVRTLPYLLVLRLLLAHRFHLDRGFWQHVGVRDLVQLVIAMTLGSVLFPAFLVVLGQLHGISPSVFVVDWLLAVSLLAGVRVSTRWAHEQMYSVRAQPGRRAFIIGAGEAGEQLVRQILHDRRCPYTVVGFIDDDPATHGRSLHGVPVLGMTDELRRLAAVHTVSHALLAVPSADADCMRRLVDCSMAAGLEVKAVPALRELVTGSAEVAQIRDVQIGDLLGREPIELELGAVEPLIAGRVVLVTGAGGSIGSELARQIARFHPLEIVLVDRAESPLYFIYREIAGAAPEARVVPVLASVTNPDRMGRVFEEHRPDCVFHAAAYKQVPMLEWNVVEGVWNNVMGTLRVARLAARYGTERFVLVSTDKAVQPTSVLGATKLVAERIVLDLPSLRASSTDFRVVRFGNVLGSEGSVVPLFKKQLAAGEPLTVTHPEVRRYFMTVPEAVQLVLHASALPEAAGRIALLEMGAQVRILDLAEQLIRLSGLVPYKDAQIVFTGLRPGEKLREELLAEGEHALPTSLDKVRIVECNGSRHDASLLARRLRRLREVTSRRDEAAILRALSCLVPEYRSVAPQWTFHRNGNGNGHANGNGNGAIPHVRLPAREPRAVPALAARGGVDVQA